MSPRHPSLKRRTRTGARTESGGLFFLDAGPKAGAGSARIPAPGRISSGAAASTKLLALTPGKGSDRLKAE
jgi:hypothetical protein